MSQTSSHEKCENCLFTGIIYPIKENSACYSLRKLIIANLTPLVYPSGVMKFFLPLLSVAAFLSASCERHDFDKETRKFNEKHEAAKHGEATHEEADSAHAEPKAHEEAAPAHH